MDSFAGASASAKYIYIYIERERESLCCVFVYVFVFACDPTEMKLIGGSSASGTDNGTVIFMN